MNQKFGYLIKWGLAALVLAIIASCLRLDDDPVTYSPAEEQAQRNYYIKGLIDEGFDVDTLNNEIYYIVLDEGEGPLVQEGDTVTLGYVGYFIDKRIFDSSEFHYADGLWKFDFKEGEAIKGWDKALKTMNKGARVQFIIPSEFAYGSSGYGTIPPYQTLVFVIKLIDLKPLDN